MVSQSICLLSFFKLSSLPSTPAFPWLLLQGGLPNLTNGKRKKASSVVIALVGNKAQEVAARPRLYAFSATLRIERKLRFGPSTQCAKCQQFGHHTTKCSSAATCRWCAGSHLTGAHTCPTSTCSTNGRPCTHTLAKCANCSGPHESHVKDCTLRVSSGSGEDMDVAA